MTKKKLIEYIWPFYVKNVSWLYALSILPPKPLPRNPPRILPLHAISWFCKEPTESHLALPAGMLTDLADWSCVGHHNSCEFKSVMSVPCHEDGCSQHSATSSISHTVHNTLPHPPSLTFAVSFHPSPMFPELHGGETDTGILCGAVWLNFEGTLCIKGSRKIMKCSRHIIIVMVITMRRRREEEH